MKSIFFEIFAILLGFFLITCSSSEPMASKYKRQLQQDGDGSEEGGSVRTSNIEDEVDNTSLPSSEVEDPAAVDPSVALANSVAAGRDIFASAANSCIGCHMSADDPVAFNTKLANINSLASVSNLGNLAVHRSSASIFSDPQMGQNLLDFFMDLKQKL